jgi:hypothetical protein
MQQRRHAPAEADGGTRWEQAAAETSEALRELNEALRNLIPAIETARRQAGVRPVPSRGADAADPPPGVPLASEVTVLVQLVATAPNGLRDAVRAALEGIPSVLRVVPDPSGEMRLRVTARSLAELLTDIDRTPALSGGDFTWSPEAGLVLRLPERPHRDQAARPARTRADVTPAEAEAAAQPEAAERPVILPAAPPSPPEAVPLAEAVPAMPAADERSARGGEKARQRPGRPRAALAVLGAAIAVLAVIAVVLALVTRSRASNPSSLTNAGSATATASTSVGITATPTAPAQVVTVTRSFTSTCVMPPDRHTCDAAEQARWNGDPAAWQALASQSGRAAPTAQEAFQMAVNLRLQMGDPSTRVDVSRSLGLPAPFLTEARFIRSGDHEDVQVEIANLGAAPADLGNARIVDAAGTDVLALPPGAALDPGQRCRLTTGPATDAPCSFTPTSAHPLTAAGPVALTLQKGADQLDTIRP